MSVEYIQMKVFHSVRTRIILISLTVLVIFLAGYTLTVWTVANGYALADKSQSVSFSLNLIMSGIEASIEDVDALVTN